MTIRTATGLIALYMRMCGFKGWTSFWNAVYVMPGYESNEPLLRHERRHLEQIKRDEQRGQRDGPIVHEIVI